MKSLRCVPCRDVVTRLTLSLLINGLSMIVAHTWNPDTEKVESLRECMEALNSQTENMP